MRELPEYIKGYLAGIIDGEGTISLHKVKGRKSPKGRGFFWRPVAHMCSTNLELVEAIVDVCEGGSVTTSEGKNGSETFYVYHMSMKVQREMIPQLLLIVKKRHKELILEALDILRNVYHLTYYDEYRLEQIYQEFKVLNKKGVRSGK